MVIQEVTTDAKDVVVTTEELIHLMIVKYITLTKIMEAMLIITNVVQFDF